MTDEPLTTAASLALFRGELVARGFTEDDARNLVKAACVEDIRQSGLGVSYPDRWPKPAANGG